MNLLISGSTGNIGKTILAKFKEKHFNVIPINLRFASTLSSNLGLLNQEDSFFFHLASQNSNMSAKNIREETNLIKSAIDIAKINAVQNFVFFSTSKLYPATDNIDDTNENSEVFSNDPYTEGKKDCELILMENINYFKSITILRLAPVLVESNSSNLNTLFRMCNKLPIIPFFPKGDSNKRSFLSMVNLINYLFILLKKNNQGLNTINICDNNFISTNRLIEIFLNHSKPHALRISIPKYLESFILKLPLIGSKLNAMFLDALLDNQKIKGENSEFKLQDTEQAMLSAQKEGIRDIFSSFCID